MPRQYEKSREINRVWTPQTSEQINKEFERVYRVMRGIGNSLESAIGDADYVIGTANPSIPNGRVPSNTATIAWNIGTPNVIEADVINNSITDAKLRTSAALSVIGRASNSAGNVADISAASASTVLRRNAANALEFAKADLLVDAAPATQAAVVLGRTDGSAGAWQELTMGAGIGISGTELVAAEGGGHYEPLANGDPVTPELIFDGDGDVIMVWVP